MDILVTFPGRYGDLLWALPTIRAISRKFDQPVYLQIAGEFKGIAKLVSVQPYIAGVVADQGWDIREPVPPDLDLGRHFSRHLHLSYRGWPEPDVVTHTRVTANAFQFDFSQADLDLQTPWIQVPSVADHSDLVIAFSETHFELKLGVIELVLEYLSRGRKWRTVYEILCPPGSRWKTDLASCDLYVKEADWTAYAHTLARTRVALCCNSGAHVLAVAMGIPVVMMEPMEARLNPVFFPVGADGPQVTLVRGIDGQPTWDSRHVADAILEKLNA